ncbi:adenine phosphoribosyltransferase [Desulfocucumis palustris]|uniref:Adenine phosphoribosyltransferase n=1 Tax=Desulfocucumis palustris TaxID=1898651 RepID=A0A2L2XE49_9FIRM|nr:adenine phosphoribosyltransferase [Desulfocucumis palustris]GBF34294.1 adenine phosphoribosyltransferase [Desulfocucumis palustris]
MDLKQKIRVIPDFPREGISYKDITTLLRDGAAYRYAVQELARQCAGKEADLIVCPKNRGLLLGAPLAYILGLGLVTVRKAGQLPGEVFTWHYDLDFGGEEMEVHKDAILPGQRVIIADELLATGGTAYKSVRLVEELGGQVTGAVFLIELTGLGGRHKLRDYDTISLVQYNY